MRLIAAPLVVALLAALPLGCGGGGHSFTSCAVLDVSGSTDTARPAYLASFKDFATQAGAKGDGNLYVVLAGADPGAEGRPAHTFVGPDKDSDHPNQDVEKYVAQAAEGVRQALLNPPVDSGASAVAEAALQCTKVLKPGDRMVLFSDGVQNSPVTGSFTGADLSDAGIQQMLATLESNGLRPDLTDVSITAPLLLVHPGGSAISAPQQQRIIAFWVAWGTWTGGSLDPDPAAA